MSTLGTGKGGTDNFYAETTRSITVMVKPHFLEEQSEPDENRFVWAYHVRIENNSSEIIQLLTRYWRITDLRSCVQEVRGDGVVGEQPVMRPGEAYAYTSGTPLTTPSGIMSGSFGMQNTLGELFDVAVPAFSLDSPHYAPPVH